MVRVYGRGGIPPIPDPGDRGREAAGELQEHIRKLREEAFVAGYKSAQDYAAQSDVRTVCEGEIRLAARAWIGALLVLLSLLSACVTPCQGGVNGSCELAPEPDYQAPALEAIRAVYRMTGPSPRFIWVATGDCAWGQRFTGFNGTCVYGSTDIDQMVSYVMLGDMDTLAHEELHVFLHQTTGDGDQDHTRPEWETIEVEARHQAVEIYKYLGKR